MKTGFPLLDREPTTLLVTFVVQTRRTSVDEHTGQAGADMDSVPSEITS
ncbi:MAG: hypothetical protein U9R47_02660 [Actinomycetota bacterium]|nr:hypothetical protein [Actinomycetota bacterium]